MRREIVRARLAWCSNRQQLQLVNTATHERGRHRHIAPWRRGAHERQADCRRTHRRSRL